MLSPTSSRKTLSTCPYSPPWNPPSFTVKLTLSSPCSSSDSPLFRQDEALAHLDSLPSHYLAISTDGSAPFPFDEGGSGVLANCSLCDAEVALFSAGRLSLFKFFRPSLRHSASSLPVSAAPTSSHFSSFLFFSNSRSVLATLSSPPSFFLPQTRVRFDRNCFLSSPLLLS